MWIPGVTTVTGTPFRRDSGMVQALARPIFAAHALVPATTRYGLFGFNQGRVISPFQLALAQAQAAGKPDIYTKTDTARPVRLRRPIGGEASNA